MTHQQRAAVRTRRLVLAGLVALVCSATASPVASAAETITHERTNAVVTTTCSSITARFRGFPEAENNTVTEIVRFGTTTYLTKTFTFNGPTGVDVIPIVTAHGLNRVDLLSKWNTNGFKGSFDIAAAPNCPTYMTGRAFGLSAQAEPLNLPVINIPPTPDTGPVETSKASTTTTPCVAEIPGAISADVLCANVTTKLSPPRSNATASVANVGIGILPLPVISATAVKATSASLCTGASGATVIASLTIGLTTYLNYEPPPNTTIALPLELGEVVLNEQVPVPGAAQGLTVNAIHVIAPSLGVNVIVASAESDIHRC